VPRSRLNARQLCRRRTHPCQYNRPQLSASRGRLQGSIYCIRRRTVRLVKLAFHDADILARIVARMSACRSACRRNNLRKSRVSDVSARIPARMSVSVSLSASWNSSLIRPRSAGSRVFFYEPERTNSYLLRRTSLSRLLGTIQPVDRTFTTLLFVVALCNTSCYE